jgi:hypothetical protein
MILLSFVSVAYCVNFAVSPHTVFEGSGGTAPESSSGVTSWVNIAFDVGETGLFIAVIGVGVVLSVICGLNILGTGFNMFGTKALVTYTMLGLLWGAVSACAVAGLMGGTIVSGGFSYSVAGAPYGLGVLVYMLLTFCYAMGCVDAVNGAVF